MAFNISYIYQIKDRATPALRKISAAQTRAAASAKKAGKGITSAFAALGTTPAGAIVTALGLVALGLGTAASKASEFEDAMAEVRKVVDFDTPDGLKKLSNEILLLVVGDVDHILRIGAEVMHDLLKSHWRGFPTVPAELFGIDYARKIILDRQGPHFQLLGRKETIGQQRKLIPLL